MERLIMARHGESEASAAGLVNGDPSRPVHLTEIGRSQARVLGERLAEETIDLCAVTSFPRTQETADIALADRHVRRLVVPALDDPVAGRLEGRPLAAYREWIRANGATTPVPDGESRVEAVRRYATGFRALAARPERTILLVGHGMSVTYALLAARDEDLPLGLEAAQVPHATPYPLGAEELGRAVGHLESWVRDHEAAS